MQVSEMVLKAGTAVPVGFIRKTGPDQKRPVLKISGQGLGVIPAVNSDYTQIVKFPAGGRNWEGAIRPQGSSLAI